MRSFTHVEEQPEFPGGPDALKSYLEKEFEFGHNTRRDLLSGNYFVLFEIKADGTTVFINIKGFASEMIVDDLKTLVNAMPRWRPRRMNGRGH